MFLSFLCLKYLTIQFPSYSLLLLSCFSVLSKYSISILEGSTFIDILHHVKHLDLIWTKMYEYTYVMLNFIHIFYYFAGKNLIWYFFKERRTYTIIDNIKLIHFKERINSHLLQFSIPKLIFLNYWNDFNEIPLFFVLNRLWIDTQ